MTKPWRQNYSLLNGNPTGMPMLVVLVLLCVGTAQPCPSKCRFCSRSMAKCEKISSLTEVLTSLSSYTEKIVLHHGNLSKLTSLSFARFSKLHFLSITKSLVRSLTDRTFFTTHVNTLRVLDLSSNHLFSCMIEPMAFSGLLLLQELILTNNSLDILRKSWFSEMPRLRKLFLGMNRITYLHPRVFENLTKLDELVMSSNLIEYLSMDTFYGIHLLTKLDLSSNRILFINHEVFQPLQALKHLHLFQNRLTILPVLPASITTLFLHENPWECSCQLVVSMKSLVPKIQSSDIITCKSPPRLVGYKVVSTRMEGCVFPTSSLPSSTPLPWSSPSTPRLASPSILNFSLLYGFLGGLLIGSVVCLLCCSCCFPKYCPCTHPWKPTESKKTFPSWCHRSFSGKNISSNVEPRILCSFPVVENLATSTCFGHLRRAPRYCGLRRRGSMDFQNPLVAVLSVEATGEMVVTLHEQGQKTGCPTQDHLCHQNHPESIDRTNEACHGNCSNQNQCSTRMELPSQKATSDQIERFECALEKYVDTQLDEWPSHPSVHLGETQPPQALIHIHLPDGSVMKIERDQGRRCEVPSKRNRCRADGLHFHASRRWSAVRKNVSSPRRQRHYYHRRPMSSRLNNAPDKRQCQEGFVARRHPDHRSRNEELSSNSDIYYNDSPLSVHKVTRKQKWKPSHDYDESSSSSSFTTLSQTEEHNLTCPKEPFIEKQSFTPLLGRKENSSPHFGDAPQVSSRHLEHGKARKYQLDSDMKRDSPTMEKAETCPRCGCGKSNPPPVIQKMSNQQTSTPKTSRKFPDVSNQQSSTGAAQFTDHDLALALLSLDLKPEQVRPKECVPLTTSSVLPPSVAVSHPEQNDVAPASVKERLSPQDSPKTVPVTEKTRTTGWRLKNQEKQMNVVDTQEIKSAIDPSMVDTRPLQSRNIRELSEERMGVQGPFEGLFPDGVGQSTLDVNKDTISAYGRAMISDSCYGCSGGFLFKMDTNFSSLDRTGNQDFCLDVHGDVCGEVLTTKTSHGPVVHKMCQIDFPLVVEEEEPSE